MWGSTDNRGEDNYSRKTRDKSFAGVRIKEARTKKKKKEKRKSQCNQKRYARFVHHRAPSKTPRTSSTEVKSARNGTRSVSSVSWGSLNHEETGTALLGWKM
jgi:hypothetical protein